MLQGISRRLFGMSLAAASSSMMLQGSWLRSLSAAEKTSDTKVKRVILLWLHGGPATIDLWDLKPEHDNGGPFKEIATKTPGMRISEHFPGLAKWSDHCAIVRSMTSREGDHGRAVHLARTGYIPQAGIDFPDLGALVAQEQAQSEAPLPGFISIAPPQRPAIASRGFLDTAASPLVVGEMAKSVDDLVVRDLEQRSPLGQSRRVDLLGQMNEHFLAQGSDRKAIELAAATQRALRMMHPDVVAAFDLEREKDSVRDRYGRTIFGQGCLLARRLAERDVPFVEVSLGGWDTHYDNFGRVAGLSSQLDSGFASLVQDLSERGMLEETLILCQGEFGRTPKINANSGRDHWPKAWAVMAAGGPNCHGQVIGSTSKDGTVVESKPYQVPDLIATVCASMGIDPMKQNDSNVNRPIRIADPSAGLIEELVG
ncbi:hypothetical protein Pan97_25150 [Bremerella volcania]|uniref:DUF1501 domain-containing protein n=1 Tax=Bremerella volcania TaxID=2527984 RepID=A0A518C8E9_9BACT|nr:DUF1501 domain-containing protein [Bremerella volcania]QDU75482.1 hypothetical protein Pan97_25150 [Bremerella volcania]